MHEGLFKCVEEIQPFGCIVKMAEDLVGLKGRGAFLLDVSQEICQSAFCEFAAYNQPTLGRPITKHSQEV